jgi:hypothetical protein
MAKQTIVPENGILRARSPYDEVYVVPMDVFGPSNVTLPNSGTYDSDELWVELNGQLLRPGIDYNFVGISAPRTEVEILQDLRQNWELRFKKVHSP